MIQPPSSAQLRPHHKFAVQCRIGSLDLDVNLELSSEWTLLFGPSGSGKSSLLSVAAGLLNGKGIQFSRRQLDDTWLPLETTPPHLRNLRWAPQHASLFPHLTVQQNIEFSERSAPGPGSPGERDFRQALIERSIHLFRLQHLLARMPRDLSGGERQRVNLARAFAAPNCKLMLLDEPFAGIDRTLRDEVLPQMRTWLRDRRIPALSVSHDVEEALQLRADVVLLRDGKVEAQGSASNVLHAERERLLQSLSLPR